MKKDGRRGGFFAESQSRVRVSLQRAGGNVLWEITWGTSSHSDRGGGGGGWLLSLLLLLTGSLVLSSSREGSSAAIKFSFLCVIAPITDAQMLYIEETSCLSSVSGLWRGRPGGAVVVNVILYLVISGPLGRISHVSLLK